MYFDTGLVTANEDTRLEQKTKDQLFRLHYREIDRSDVLIHDLDDKIKVVNRLDKKGVWI
jgi:hypothetical protein